MSTPVITNATTTLGEVISASTEKADPLALPDAAYIGLEHIEKETGVINGFEKAASVRSTKSVFRRGDLLYGKLRPYLNKVWVAEFDGVCSTDILVYPKTENVDNRFLKYRFMSRDFVNYAAANSNGVNLPRVNAKVLAQFPLWLPPLDEQRRIVAEIEKQFTRLDAGVSALQRVRSKLKQYRAAVLKAACEGRLVPTEAELARAQNRDTESAEVLLERILQERRAKWNGRGKYSEPAPPSTPNLPPLPEGWVWTNIDQLAEVGTGATPKRGTAAFYDGGKIPWVTSAALNKPFVDEASEFVTSEALAKTNLSLYAPGTLLVAMYGEGKTRGKCSELRIEATTNQAIAAIQCAHYIRDFLKLSLWRQYEYLRLTASGGVQPNLNLSLVRNIIIPLPPLAEQERIVAEVERRLSVVDELEATVTANLQRAARLRQAILQKAFSGERQYANI